MRPHPHELRALEACTRLAPLYSTCAKRQYFAVVLAPNGRWAGVGYNGSPPGMAHCIDGACPRLREEDTPGSSYDTCIAQHAEAGALLWSDPALRQQGTLVVNGPPCMGCAKLIASSGLHRLVHLSNALYAGYSNVVAFLREAGITVAGVEATHLAKISRHQRTDDD